MATRTITRYEPRFDEAGMLTSYRAAGLIGETGGYTEADGNQASMQLEEWYAAPPEELPAQFIADLEMKRTQIGTELEERYPMPDGTTVTRIVVGFLPAFNLAGELLEFSVMATLIAPGSYTDGSGKVRDIRRGLLYTVTRQGLPSGFIADLETIRTQTQNKIDELYPMPE
jgi:hypothetical protein